MTEITIQPDQHTYNDRPFFAGYVFVLLVLISIYGVGLSLAGSSYDRLFREGGYVENLSAILYFVLAAVICVKSNRRWLMQRHYFLTLILMLGFRELDFDKAFTTMGILKSRFYISPDVPVIEKLAGGLILLLLIYSLYRLVRNHGKAFLKGSIRWQAECMGIWLAGLFLVLSKSIDGLDRKLEGVGVEISYAFTENAAAFEETLELGIPAVMMLAVCAFWGRQLIADRLNRAA